MANRSYLNSTTSTVIDQLQFYHCFLLGDVFQWRNEYLTAGVHTSSVAAAITSGFLCPLTTLANIFVIVTFLKTRLTLRLNRINMLLSSLSITDFIIGIVVHPFFVVCRISEIIGIEKWVCIGRYVYKTAAVLCVGSSMAHLAFISIERLVVFAFPRKHKDILSRTRTGIVITGIWLYYIAGCVLISPLVAATPKRELIARASHISIFTVSMICCYAWIVCKVRKEVKPANRGQENENITSILKETKLAKTMAYTCLAFSIFCLPEAISNTMVASGKFDGNTMVHIVSNWPQLLAFSNSLFNPVWYSFKVPVVRRAISRYIRTFRPWFNQGRNKTSSRQTRKQNKPNVVTPK